MTAGFTCPVCGAVSHNAGDARHGYCGRCHGFTGVEIDPALAAAMLIVTRCREEGRIAKLAGVAYASCPHSDALERAAWLDGRSKG